MARETALTVLIICGCIGSTIGLQCYFCSQDPSNPGCGEPFDASSTQVMTCPGNDSVCSTATFSGSYTRTCNTASACTQSGCVDDICLSCCDGDLCNGQSIEEGIKDILHCYTCVYDGSSNNATTTDGATTGPCGDPFDAEGEGVISTPCPEGSQCGVARVSIPGDEAVLITRTCFNQNIQPCNPGCLGPTCMSCCSENLCNTGPVPVPHMPDHASSPEVVGVLLATSLLAAACLQ